jgi:hypothetical protein
MSSFQLDDNMDLVIENNSLVMTEGQEAIRQHLLIKLQTFLGEWFLDEDVGVPYYQEILVKQPSFQTVSQVLRAQIIDTPGVIELLNFDFVYSADRELRLDFRAETIDGPIDFSQIIEV